MILVKTNKGYEKNLIRTIKCFKCQKKSETKITFV